MGHKSKTISVSDEIAQWLNELKAKYGSYNKGLTLLKASVPFGSDSDKLPRLAYSAELERVKQKVETRRNEPYE